MDQTTEITTPDDLVDDALTYKPEAMNALREWAAAKPWKGTPEQRWAKLNRAMLTLTEAYGLERLTWKHVGPMHGDTGASRYDAEAEAIVFTGRPSVVTTLYLLAIARGVRHAAPMVWAATAFKRRFPLSFGRCEVRNGLLVNTGLEARERERLGD